MRCTGFIGGRANAGRGAVRPSPWTHPDLWRRWRHAGLKRDRVPWSRGEKGISTFEQLLEPWQHSFVEQDTALLRTTQGIRSQRAAHRKGSDYNLTQTGFNSSNFNESFKQLLERGTMMLTNFATFAGSRLS